MAGFSYYWANVLFAGLVGIFLYIRQNDISEASFSTLTNVMLGIVGISTMTLFWSPSKTIGTLVRRLALISLVLMQLKHQLDSVGQRVQIRPRKGGFYALITGGNGSLGRNTAAALMEMDINVVLACRDVRKCEATADMLKKQLPNKSSFVNFAKYSLDLSDLNTIRTFSDHFIEEHNRLDYLIHAAGSLALGGQKSQNALEESFGTIYLGPFSLSHWLMPLLLKPVDHNPSGSNAARIVSLVSHSAFHGHFSPSMFSSETRGDFENEVTDNCGKPDSLDSFSALWCMMGKKPLGVDKENGYARANLGIILGTQELQRRIDQFLSIPSHNVTYRRLVTAAVNPGVVSSTFSSVHTILGPILRPPTTAAALVVHALQSDDYLPSSYIDSAFNAQDLGEYADGGLGIHLKAFPKLSDMNLGFLSASSSSGVYSSSTIKFKAMKFITDITPSSLVIDHRVLSARLYDVSLQFIADIRDKKELYTTKIVTSSNIFKFLRRT